MITRQLTLTLASALLLASCATRPYEKSDTGVTVNVGNADSEGARLVRLQVLGDKLIRVSATPDKKFADNPSLVVVPQEATPKFEVVETDSSVQVITGMTHADSHIMSIRLAGYLQWSNLSVNLGFRHPPLSLFYDQHRIIKRKV